MTKKRELFPNEQPDDNEGKTEGKNDEPKRVGIDLDSFTPKSERKDDNKKSRVTMFLSKGLAERLDRLAKDEYGKGFKSRIAEQAITDALDQLQEKEERERNGGK